jgi:hypothetical protein
MSDDRASATPDEGGPEGGARSDRFEVRITGTDETLARLLHSFDLDVGCRHAHVDRNPDGSATILVFASEARLAEIQAAGYRAEKGDNVSARGRALRKQIGVGDRFEGGRVAPTGFGVKGRGGGQGRAS